MACCEWRSNWLPVVLVVLAARLFATASPAGAAEDLRAASSSQAVEDQARAEIPWKKLSPNDQRLTQYVVTKPSVFRRSPTHTFDCDPQVFNFLSEHPEVVVNVWNLMGVSKLSLVRRGDGQFHAADNAGAQGDLRVMHSQYEPDSRNTVVAFADGTYQVGPMPEPIHAHCVLVLKSGSRRDSNGHTFVSARLDSFIRFERVGTDLIAKTLKPLIVKSADHNFTETMKFVSTFSQTAQERPEGLLNLTQRLERVDEATRNELAVLCRETAARRVSAIATPTDVKVAKLQAAAASAVMTGEQ